MDIKSCTILSRQVTTGYFFFWCFVAPAIFVHTLHWIEAEFVMNFAVNFDIQRSMKLPIKILGITYARYIIMQCLSHFDIAAA